MSANNLADNLVLTPYWWDDAPRPKLSPVDLPGTVDVAVVGSGYTGLSAALDLARSGLSVLVIDAGDPGSGASSRNTGSMGRTFRHSFSSLLKSFGPERAVAVYKEVAGAFAYTSGLIERERIDCKFTRSGRFTGAASAKHYEAIAKEVENKSKHLSTTEILVPQAKQNEEIGFGRYYGGLVIPDVGTIHPGHYHLGLLSRVREAGATIAANTRVTRVHRDARGFIVSTSRGAINARQVVLATNGYTEGVSRYLQRRVIPFPAFIAATEPVSESIIRDVLPGRRVFQETKNNPFFMRLSPDGSRFLFGALAGSSPRDLRRTASKLHHELASRVPQLAQTKISHIWTGKCAATFSIYPHIGVHDGIHFAMGYCFAGISMGTYLGHKVAQRLLGTKDASTVFDTVPFETRPYHWGKPWFVPIAAGLMNWKDRKVS